MRKKRTCLVLLAAALCVSLWGCGDDPSISSGALSEPFSAPPSASSAVEADISSCPSSSSSAVESGNMWFLPPKDTYFLYEDTTHFDWTLFNPADFGAEFRGDGYHIDLAGGSSYEKGDVVYSDKWWLIFYDGTRVYNYGGNWQVATDPPTPTVVDDRVVEYNDDEMTLSNGITIEDPFEPYTCVFTPTDDPQELVQLIKSDERYGYLLDFLKPEFLESESSGAPSQ